MSKALKVSKLGLKNMKSIYFATLLAMQPLIITIVEIIAMRGRVAVGYSSNISPGMFLWPVILFAASVAPSHFPKMLSLGAKRKDFFWGFMLLYGLLAAIVSLLNITFFLTFDRFMQDYAHFYAIFNLLEIFGWAENGIIIAFFRQTAFLFLFASFIHTLASVQDRWYGWVADIAIIAIISVFTPIAPLRAALVFFLNLITFEPNAFLHIAYCLALGIGIYMLNKPIYERKQ